LFEVWDHSDERQKLKQSSSDGEDSRDRDACFGVGQRRTFNGRIAKQLQKFVSIINGGKV
jgi:hypothetical protein